MLAHQSSERGGPPEPAGTADREIAHGTMEKRLGRFETDGVHVPGIRERDRLRDDFPQGRRPLEREW
jgi:hypothetical protein